MVYKPFADDTSSPETDLRLPSQDADSGHSTQHSPDGAKSMSPQAIRGTCPASHCKGRFESVNDKLATLE